MQAAGKVRDVPSGAATARLLLQGVVPVELHGAADSVDLFLWRDAGAVRVLEEGVRARYVVVKKVPGMPRFDERFVNYGYNKVEFLTELRYSGWRFYVLGTAFGIDVPHPRSKYQQKFVSTIMREHRMINKDVFSQFFNELVKRKKQSVIRTCGKRSREVDIDASIDFCSVWHKHTNWNRCTRTMGSPRCPHCPIDTCLGGQIRAV